MVGVPGKYKGCETCRLRRVKCSNERPFCQKCISTGRKCEGYERERVFITGTLATKGRVASHPKKELSCKSQESPSVDRETPSLQLAPLEPLTSAWDNQTFISNRGVENSVFVAALHTKLPQILWDTSRGPSAAFHINYPPYMPLEVQTLFGERDFHVQAHCLAHIPEVGEYDGSDESYCVFFFDHILSHTHGNSGSDQMKMTGPAHYSHFPNHHFFVRVYRPLATGFAVLSRQNTFVSNPEWMSVPWQKHPKGLMDQLLDLVLYLPSIFVQTDGLAFMDATLHRRHRAQQLLQNSLSLERHFETWRRVATRPTDVYPLAYWTQELTSPGGLIPFPNPYIFKDGGTGLAFLYYWMAHILFHRCIETLHRIVFQPIIDVYPSVWPELPPDLQIDVTRYQQSRLFAADICRGLDFVLESTSQPDMLVAPMTAAIDFYREINTASQDGLIELMWLDGFWSRLIIKGQSLANTLQGQRWKEVAVF